MPSCRISSNHMSSWNFALIYWWNYGEMVAWYDMMTFFENASGICIANKHLTMQVFAVGVAPRRSAPRRRSWNPLGSNIPQQIASHVLGDRLQNVPHRAKVATRSIITFWMWKCLWIWSSWPTNFSKWSNIIWPFLSYRTDLKMLPSGLSGATTTRNKQSRKSRASREHIRNATESIIRINSFELWTSGIRVGRGKLGPTCCCMDIRIEFRI